MAHVVDIDFLSRTPGGLGDHHGVGATFHDLGNRVAKSPADILDSPQAAGILAGIVQERR